MKLKRGLVILFSLGLLSGCGLIPSQNESDEVKTELLEEDTKNSDLVKTNFGTKSSDDELEDGYTFPDLVTIHYHRDDNAYDDKRFWIWSDNAAPEIEFEMVDEGNNFTYAFTFSPMEVFKIEDPSFSFMVKVAGTWSGKSAEIPILYKDYPPTLQEDGTYLLEIWALARNTGFDIYKTEEDARSDQISKAFISSDFKKINVYTSDGTGNGESILTELKIYKFTQSYASFNSSLQQGKKEDYLLFSASNINKSSIAVKFSKTLTLNCKYVLEAKFKDKPEKTSVYTLTYENLYETPEFSALSYNGDDLGAHVVRDGNEVKTVFKVWAPTASLMQLKLYDYGYDKSYLDETKYNNIVEQGIVDAYELYDMELNLQTFVWEVEIPGDLSGKYYTYRVINTAGTNDVVDPYAQSAGIDGSRGMIVDFDSEEAKPSNWDELPLKWDGVEDLDITTPQELVVSEVHIRDLTMSDTWNGPKEKQGLFTGFIEEGTTYNGVKTGYDHLVEYGVNAIQLLPIFDQDNAERARKEVVYNEGSENEKVAQVVDYDTLGDFNWGYNPLNYNALEGGYSSDPRNGYTRIKEFRELVQKFATNENHTRIIMDVVYNHVSSAPTSNFERLMPKYYYRLDDLGGYSDASGCGNEVKTEAPMMRKFIIDSVCQWATNYKIKGFRFDLMGAIDLKTMSDLTDALYDIDPDIVVYGEGWYATAPRLNSNYLAVNQNLAQYLYPNRTEESNTPYVGDGYVGGFNNGGRDALKGDNDLNNAVAFSGLISNTNPSEDVIRRSKLMLLGANGYGGCGFNPLQNVNYVSCHDNYTLFDQLNWNLGNSTHTIEPDIETVARASVAVNGMVLMSNGISFINGGEEIFRTKIETSEEIQKDEVNMYGKRITHNSYKSPDATNAYDYGRKAELKEYFDMYCQLVELKKDLKFSSEIVDESTYSSGTIANIETLNSSGNKLGLYREGISGNYHIYFNGPLSSQNYTTKGSVVFSNIGTLSVENGNVGLPTNYGIVIVKE